MNFYFCETCGKRITDQDLAAGQGRNKQLKGYFCGECAVGVMTVELDAINLPTPATAEMPVAKPANNRVSSGQFTQRTRVATPPHRALPLKAGDIARAQHAHVNKMSAPRASAAQSDRKVMLGVGAAGVVLVLGLAVAVFGGSKAPPSVKVADQPAKQDAPPVANGAAPASTVADAPKIVASAPEKSTSPSPAPAPVTATDSEPLPKSSPTAFTPEAPITPAVAAVPASAAPTGSAEKPASDEISDIRENYAQRKLDEIEQQSKNNALSATQLREQYSGLAVGSYSSTQAGKKASDRLKSLPAAPMTDAMPLPAPAAPTPSAAPATPASAITPSATANSADAKSVGVWWEAEQNTSNNFISHPWLSTQLDTNNLSGGKYLNYLDDPVLLKAERKKRPDFLYASFAVDVPVTGVYTLWVREYDPFSSVLWKFRWWGGQPWTEVPADYPFENKVEIGKDRWLVWRKYPNQKLTKGPHKFELSATITEHHSVAGFDCFYLTSGTFKPDGTKKPSP